MYALNLLQIMLLFEVFLALACFLTDLLRYNSLVIKFTTF